MLKLTGFTIVAAGVAVPASAGVFDVFTARTQWLLAVDGPVVTEGFEGRDAIGPLGSPSVFDTGLGVAALGGAAGQSAVDDEATTPAFSMQNTTPGGMQFLRFGLATLAPADYTQQYFLPNDTNAFGFNIIDWEPGFSSQTGGGIRLYNDGNLVFGGVIPSDNQTDGIVSFIGFTSDTFVFDEVRFTVFSVEGFNVTPSLDVTGVDEVAWVVPAPGSVAVLGLAGLSTGRRRRTIVN